MNHMAVDQYGVTYHDLGEYPRKELMKRLYALSANKMYVDTIDGGAKHIGYVIRGHWLTVLEVGNDS